MKCIRCKKFAKINQTRVCFRCSIEQVGRSNKYRTTSTEGTGAELTSEQMTTDFPTVRHQKSNIGLQPCGAADLSQENFLEEQQQQHIQLHTCRNCRRKGPVDNNVNIPYTLHVQVHDVTIWKRQSGWNQRKFNLVGRLSQLTTHIPLCQECRQYLCCAKANNQAKLVWPSFVWSVLRRRDCFRGAWTLVPAIWRTWWKDAVSQMHGLPIIDLCSAMVVFQEVSHELKLDLAALRSLTWTELMSREQSLALPLVKCPAGCSEFKHKTTSLPMDIVWQELLQVKLAKLYTTVKASMHFTRIFREDYLSADPLISNKNWLVQPSIALEGDVPSILACRNHSTRSVFQLIHPPRNPTGSISDCFAGGLSPITVIPRTISTAQASSYSASFHMSRLQGSYFGLDTMYLSTTRNIRSNSHALAWQQDVLSYANRKDIRGSVASNPRAQACLSELESSAQDLYPYLDELKNLFCTGASHVTTSQCVKLHAESNFGTADTAIVFSGPETALTSRIVQFQPGWCRQLIWAQPATSLYGCRPPILDSFYQCKVDGRLGWIFHAMLCFVPTVWSLVAQIRPKSNMSWEGWMLDFCTKKSLPHIKRTAKHDPFHKGQTATQLCERFFCHDNNTDDFDITLLPELLCDTVAQSQRVLLCQDQILEELITAFTKVVIVYRDNLSNNMAMGETPFIPCQEIGKIIDMNSCSSLIHLFLSKRKKAHVI
jgi:hypothetical protein